MTGVLGLDLSITATGICYPNGHTTTITGKPAAGDRRITTVADIVNEALTAWKPPALTISLVVIEDLLTHAKAAHAGPALVHGAVRYVLQKTNTPYVLVTPATLKAFATGKGNANKTDMAIAALKRGNREFVDDNQCDAWWLRAAGLHHLGHPEFELPAAQRARLDKVAWPPLGRVLL